MSEPTVFFTLDGVKIKIQCSKDDNMKDICQKFASKIRKKLSSFIFLYGGNQVKFDYTFYNQATSIDKSDNQMNILVYRNDEDEDEYVCPICGEKIPIDTKKIDVIIESNNSIKETINGIKLQLDNIIKNSLLNEVNIQLKNICVLLNNINQDINQNSDKLRNLLKDFSNNNDSKNKCFIKGVLDIKANEINNSITLFNTNFNNKIEVILNNEKVKMIQEENKWKYKFNKDGKYTFEIVFKDIITDLNEFFSQCSNLISLDFSNFDTSKVTNMSSMFNECNSLKEIQGLDKFITNNVTDMSKMFNACYKLESLDLSNFDTSNVKNMLYMFCNCYKLKEIKGIDRFITNNVMNMGGLFGRCYELEYLNLSNFNTSNVMNMAYMFNECSKLKGIKGLEQFITNKVIIMNTMFQSCFELEYLDLSSFNTANVNNMSYMFNNCNKLKEIKGINKFITNNVKDMKLMFNQCYKLESLDLSNYNTCNVTNMQYMFHNCNSLKYLNLKKFVINCDTKDMLNFQRNGCNFITDNNELLALYNSS